MSVVLVTGSSSGIGLATARRFAERGDSVVFNSAHSVEAGEHASDSTPGSHYVRADIADPDLEAANLDVWREIFEVNVFGTWQLSVAAMTALRESQGSIVNVSSVAGIRPTGSSIPYAASKAALNHMTVLLAKVVGPEVRVNAVAPGLVDTPWTADWDTVREGATQVTPLQRSGQPGDVAEVILALAGAAYVTGQVVVIDGGLSLAT